jgi:hypothetical protein
VGIGFVGGRAICISARLCLMRTILQYMCAYFVCLHINTLGLYVGTPFTPLLTTCLDLR